MGMQTQCPYCGIMFIIPVIDPHALQAAYGMQGGAAYAPQQESYLPGEMQEIYDPTATQPGLRDFLGQVAAGEVAEQPHPEQPHGVGAVDYESASVALQDGGTPGCVHIPCPNGHELETPFDMLGQEVLCPHCGAQFRLRNEDSREYLEKLEKRERERGKFWFNWAVTAAILIGGGLLVMVAVALSK